MAEDKVLIQLYNHKCASCIHLFPNHPRAKSHTKCHYSNGNDLCPASEMQFIVAIDKKTKILELISSFEDDDIEGAIEQLKKITKFDKEQKKDILSQLKNHLSIKESKSKKSKG